jgi:hypothetical protein
MKAVIIFFILIWFESKSGYCQTTNGIAVPVLKENSIIDSLINTTLNPQNNPATYDTNEKYLKDSCMIIDITKGKNGYNFNLEINNKANVNLFVNAMVYTKRNFGCFKFRNFKVFVWSESALFDFFSKTSKNKAYDFIYKMTFDEAKHARGLLPGYVFDYEYKHGKLSPMPPPPSIK